jgi:hypothetical protein
LGSKDGAEKIETAADHCQDWEANLGGQRREERARGTTRWEMQPARLVAIRYDVAVANLVSHHWYAFDIGILI